MKKILHIGCCILLITLLVGCGISTSDTGLSDDAFDDTWDELSGIETDISETGSITSDNISEVSESLEESLETAFDELSQIEMDVPDIPEIAKNDEIEPLYDEKVFKEAFEEAFGGLPGHVSNDIYENETLGIGCKIGPGWTYSTEEEILENNRQVLEILSDPDVAVVDSSELDNQVYTDMSALSSDMLKNIAVSYTKLSVLDAHILTEEIIAAYVSEMTVSTFEKVGLENCTVSEETKNVFGENHSIVHIESFYNEVPVYQTAIIMLKDRYYGMVVATSFVEDTTDDILSWFYSID